MGKLKHRRAISFITIMLMLVMLLFTNTNATAQSTNEFDSFAAQKEYRLIGYYASWAGYARNFGIDKVDYSNLTHLNFAFANLKTDGTVVVGDPWIDCQITSLYPSAGFTWEDQSNNTAGHFGMLKKIKEKYPNLKTLISIGGWTWSNNFSDVAADPVKRERMANSAVEFILKYGFDGIDIDWEYPVEGGNNIPHRPSDKQNYVELVKIIRQKLDAQSAKDGNTYLLTIASSANQNYVNNMDVTEMMKYLDWINLMTYDYHGGFDPQTNHNSPLYLNPNDTTGSIFSIEATVDAYINSGANPKDLNLGLPYYGRGWINVNASPENSLFQNGSAATLAGTDLGTWEGSSWDYWDIIDNYIGKRGYVRYWDDTAKCPYLYSEQTKVFITYDDKESLGYKLDYIKSRNLGGGMFWECSGDKGGELLSFTASSLGINNAVVTPTPSITQAPTPTTLPTPTITQAPTPSITQVPTPSITQAPTPTPTDNTIEAWSNTKTYVAGDKVVYNGNIFEAKWWTLGDVPGTAEWGPWKLIEASGKELVSAVVNANYNDANSIIDKGSVAVSLNDETIPLWDKSTTYVTGNQVRYNGAVYEAKWWTLGDTPSSIDWGPWKYIRTVGEVIPTPIPTLSPSPSPSPTPSPIITPSVSPTPIVTVTPAPTVPPSDLPKYVLTGYWQNFNNGATSLKISDVPSTYQLICVAFAESTSTLGEVTFKLDSGLSTALGGYTEEEFIKDIAAAKVKGQKVIISVGGEVGTVSVANDTQANIFANSLYKLITKYGFDGVDIDLEHGISATYMEKALRSLYDKVGPSLIITMAPQTIDMQSTGYEYFKLALAIKDILTICNTQYYNSGAMLGYDGKVYSQGTVDFLTALATIQLENGLRPDQVGLGLPASIKGAGGGYVDPSIVTSAFKSLVTGSKAGNFVAPRTYPSLRGVMTWSINWDAQNNYKFSNAIAACFEELK